MKKAVIFIVLSIFFTPITFAETLPIPPQQITQVLQSQDVTPTIEGEWVVYDFTKPNSQIIVSVPKLSTLSFEYESINPFRIQYTSLSQQGIQAQFLLSKYIYSNTSSTLSFDFLSSPNWGEGNGGILLIEGQGTLKLKNIKITHSETNLESKHNWASWFIPEQIRHTSINFVTPIFWKASQNQYWNYIAGIFFIIVSTIIWFMIYLKKLDPQVFPLLIIIFCLLYTSHHLYNLRDIYFHDLSHIIASTEDKLTYNSMDPILGELLAKTHSLIQENDTIMVWTYEGDWFHRQNICYNMLPNTCVFDTGTGSGIRNYYQADLSDIDFILTYNNTNPIPENFKEIYPINNSTKIFKKQ